MKGPATMSMKVLTPNPNLFNCFYNQQIGEYLMLLPQNLEPFIVIENSSISYAFDQTAEE
jgi:hypothetical protein